MAYDNTNSGMLARNDRKEKETQPDFTGAINVDGIDYWLSAWTKTGGEGSKMAGRKYFSLSVKQKDGQSSVPSSAPAAAAAPRPVEDSIDDCPF